jgi:hypothetical protein
MTAVKDFLYSPFARTASSNSALLSFELPPSIVTSVQKTDFHNLGNQAVTYVHRVISLKAPLPFSPASSSNTPLRSVDMAAVAWAPIHVFKHMKIVDGSWVTIGSGSGRLRRAQLFLSSPGNLALERANQSNNVNSGRTTVAISQNNPSDSEDDDLADLYDDTPCQASVK